MNNNNSKLHIEIIGIQELMEMIQKLTAEVQELKAKILGSQSQKMNRADVAEYLGLSWGQIETLSYLKGQEPKNTKKILPYIRIGKNFLYERTEVEKAKATLRL